MQAFPKQEPLTDPELDRLAEFLRACKGGKAMNIEELDGFFGRPRGRSRNHNAERVLPAHIWWDDGGHVRVRDLRSGQRRPRSDDATLEHHRRNPVCG